MISKLEKPSKKLCRRLCIGEDRCNAKAKFCGLLAKESYVLCMCQLDEDVDKDVLLCNVVYELSKRIVARKMLQFSMFEWWRNF